MTLSKLPPICRKRPTPGTLDGKRTVTDSPAAAKRPVLRHISCELPATLPSMVTVRVTRGASGATAPGKSVADSCGRVRSGGNASASR